MHYYVARINDTALIEEISETPNLRPYYCYSKRTETACKITPPPPTGFGGAGGGGGKGLQSKTLFFVS